MGTGRKTAEGEQVTKTVINRESFLPKAIWKAWALNSHVQKLIRVFVHYLLLASAGATLSAFKRIAGTILARVFGCSAAPSFVVSGCREHRLETLFQLPGQLWHLSQFISRTVQAQQQKWSRQLPAMREVSTNSCAGPTSTPLVVDALRVSFLTSQDQVFTNKWSTTKQKSPVSLTQLLDVNLSPESVI